MSLFLINPISIKLMRRASLFLLLLFCACALHSQNPDSEKESARQEDDSIRKREFLKQLGNGFLPTRYINIDLRYLLKYNQFEGLRTGLGGETNTRFSEKYRDRKSVV